MKKKIHKISQSGRLVPSNRYLKIVRRANNPSPATKGTRMYSRQATTLQDMRPHQETPKQHVEALQDETNVHGVREAKQHSVGRGRGAR